MPFFPEKQHQPFFAALSGVLLASIAVFMVAATAVKIREYRVIGSTPVERTLTVSGMGSVRAASDVASVRAGVTVEAIDAGRAQRASNEKMENVVASLRGVGVSESDIQTSNYSVNPRYEYPRGGDRILRGHVASQSVFVTIRDLEIVNGVFDALRSSGATDVGALQFSIDDTEALEAQAREEAIMNARARAQTIASQLGVRLGKATNFSESGFGSPPVMLERAMAAGGEMDSASNIQTGENEITSSVTVTYAME
jgi:uncharacterized protein